jgi:hypothetical protein
MKGKGFLRRLLVLPVAVVMVLALAPASNAQEEHWIQLDDQLAIGSSEPFFVGGAYSWGTNIWLPFDPTAYPVAATFDWGDGTEPTVGHPNDPAAPYFFECFEVTQCSTWFGHTYESQGPFTINVTVHQDGPDGVTVHDARLAGEAFIYDLAVGGSVRGSGTLTARSGGMYDQEFTQGLMSFQINAKRRADSAGTTVALTVDVPSMQADATGGTEVTGMHFVGTAATRPLYVERLAGRGNYEVYLERVFGHVSNSEGAAGTALGMFHATVTRGQPTLLRIEVWNTDAGYTYVSTATAAQGWYDLDLDNALLSGSVKVG